jgi:hypothetical protein
MFSSNHASSLGRRLSTGLRLIRSFLLLEDDCDVDWEVDRDEPSKTHRCGARPPASRELSERPHHPHRMALRSRLDARRPGLVVPSEQLCLCPLPGGKARDERGPQRGSRITTGSVREAIDR